MKSNRERAFFFEKPDVIPMTFHMNSACWNFYPQDWICEMFETHPILFPGYRRPEFPVKPLTGMNNSKDHPYTDDFGCTWTTAIDGITGTVTGHPLADWGNYKNYRFPDPAVSMGLGPISWDGVRRGVEAAKARGEMGEGGLRHGHTFLQLSDIRGYENLLYDMADEEPLLWDLIEKLEAFNAELTRRLLDDCGIGLFSFPEDLGMQSGPMLSPEHFRKYIKPSYSRILKMARDRDVPVLMHSDGDIRLLIDDIIDSGVQVMNLQDRVNGIAWIRDNLKGRVCIELDIDRQYTTVFGTPQDIDDMIREEVETLACPDGGLLMIYGWYPGVPMENAKALMDAMEKYSQYYT